MTDTPEIARIRAALAAGPTPGPWEPWGSPTPTQFICSEDALIAQTTTGNDVANAGLILSCNPEAMTALLAHIDAQAAEIERLRADAGQMLVPKEPTTEMILALMGTGLRHAEYRNKAASPSIEEMKQGYRAMLAAAPQRAAAEIGKAMK